MKTINFNNQQTCERQSYGGHSSFSLPVLRGGLWHVAMMRSLTAMYHQLPHRIASVTSEILVSRNALTSSVSVNWRIYTGLVLIGVVAPVALTFYKLFDATVINSDWFHLNFFYLFFNIGPCLSQAFLIIGVYHLFPYGDWKAKILIVPLSFNVAKLFTNIVATSNQEYHNVQWYTWLCAPVAIITFFYLMDKFCWRKYHDFDGKMARLSGLVSISSMPQDEKERLNGEILKAKSFSF